VKAYNRPIFVGSDHARHLDIMMYVGVRWVLFDSNQGFKYLEEPTTLEIADYFLERGTNFHASELQNIEFITEPIKFDSPLDKVTPTNERWYSTRGVEIKDLEIVLPLDIVMLCEICDEIANPCFNGNRCLPSGQCLCSNGATGKLCQIRPLRDGRCHQAFNTPTFDFDGGDCCKSTCISTDKNSCGVRNEDGKLESVNVGFPDCIDPLSKCVGSGCWFIKSHQIPLLTQKSDHGLKSLVKLSANGRILVLSEPALDAVRVFDQIDSRWIQRGQILEGDRDSGFGRMSSISSTPGSVFGRRFGRVPLELAIVHFYEGHPWIRAFRWLPNDADWRVFTDIDICSFLAEDQRELCDVCTLDIGSDHDSVTVAIGLDNGKALIFRTDVTEIAIKPWHLVALMDGHHVSLSGDSHRLATAIQYGDTISLFRIVNSGTDVKDTMLIPIGQHIISTHFDFDLHNGALIDYSGYASHIEKIQLSSDGGSLALAAYGDEGDDFLLHYTVSIDRIGYDAAKRIKLPEHSQSEKLSGLTTIYFSDAASVVAVRHHLDESHDEVQIFEHKMVIGGLYTWGPLGRVFDSVTPEEDFSISHDGTSIVFGGQVAASVYELHDRCREEEVHFRLSIILDAYPVNVTWSLQTVRQLGHLQIPRFVLKNCGKLFVM